MSLLEPASLAAFVADVRRLESAIATRIVGQGEVVSEVLTALLAGGHVLLEGAPGLGKTLLVRTLAEASDLRFRRIQFTPDLMPSDIVGTHMVAADEAGRRRFEFVRGPIFAELVLADEVNRASPKTQSALLEAMAEHSVTVAGERNELPAPFFVLATENPIEMEGTYPLPEAQLDRFLLKVLVPSPDEATLVGILDATTTARSVEVPTILGRDRLLELQRIVREVLVAPSLLRFAAQLVRRADPSASEAAPEAKRYLRFGPGVRGAQSMVLAAKAWAAMNGRAHVAESDLRRMALPTLRHRLVRSFEAEADAVTPDTIVAALLAGMPSVGAPAQPRSAG